MGACLILISIRYALVFYAILPGKEVQIVWSSVASIQVLPGYRLRLRFCNGSGAMIHMEQRIRGIRFQRLADPSLFQSAQIQGDAVVWDRGNDSIRATVSELLDSMMM